MMGLRRRHDLEREGKQRIAGQHGRGFVEFLVRRRHASAQVVIVHAGQVVMNQRIGVHALKGAGHAGCPIGRHVE